MQLTDDIYLNCGIYDTEKFHNLLFIAVPSYFASSAWCDSDKKYNDILGNKFEAITSDDCRTYNLRREYVRRLNKKDNIDKLLSNSCEDFKIIFEQRFK